MGVLDAERAAAVVEHRKHMRRALTPYAAKLLARKFSKTADPNAAADAMIANGWQGFEPEWMRGAERSGREHSPQVKKSVRDVAAERLQALQGSNGHVVEHG